MSAAAAAASSAAVSDSSPAAEPQLLQRQLLLDEQQLLQRRREQLDAFESLEQDAADLQEIFTDLAAMTAVRSRRSVLAHFGLYRVTPQKRAPTSDARHFLSYHSN